MRRLLSLAIVTSLTVAACSPGPHDNPIIGVLVLGLAALSVVTVIGGIAWLLGHPGGPRLPTLMHGLARSLATTLVVAVVAAGLLYVGLQVRTPVERPLAYWTIDDHTVGVLVGDAVDLSCEVARVEESGDAVRIHARCWERVLPVPGPGMLQAYVLEATLQAPLGTRTVHDGLGNPGQLCSAPFPTGDCHIPG